MKAGFSEIHSFVLIFMRHVCICGYNKIKTNNQCEKIYHLHSEVSICDSYGLNYKLIYGTA